MDGIGKGLLVLMIVVAAVGAVVSLVFGLGYEFAGFPYAWVKASIAIYVSCFSFVVFLFFLSIVIDL